MHKYGNHILRDFITLYCKWVTLHYFKMFIRRLLRRITDVPLVSL